MTREGASAFALAAEQLGDVMKMLVPRDQTQVIFQRECSDPEIVVWNLSAGTLELDEQTRGMLADWYPVRLSLPLIPINLALRSQDLVEGRI
jgi:hypothetical protein